MAGTEEKSGRGGFTLAVFGLAIMLNLILTVMLIYQVSRTRDEVSTLAQALPSRADVAMVRPVRVRSVLEDNCEGCHTLRKLQSTWDMSGIDIVATVARMGAHPGNVAMTPDTMLEVGAAIVASRCTSCHDESTLSKLGLMPRTERERYITNKVAMPGSGFRVDQAGMVVEAFRVLMGEQDSADRYWPALRAAGAATTVTR